MEDRSAMLAGPLSISAVRAVLPDSLQNWKVDEGPLGCWIWQGTRAKKTGYAGSTSYRGRKGTAYRLIYEVVFDVELPRGRTRSLDHLCDNGGGGCVNPFHLRFTTQQVNTTRSPATIPGQHVRKTHCPQGHPYSGDNLLLYGPNKQWRKCKACQYGYAAKIREAKREEYRARARKKYRENHTAIRAQRNAAAARRRERQDA